MIAGHSNGKVEPILLSSNVVTEAKMAVLVRGYYNGINNKIPFSDCQLYDIQEYSGYDSNADKGTAKGVMSLFALHVEAYWGSEEVEVQQSPVQIVSKFGHCLEFLEEYFHLARTLSLDTSKFKFD